MADYIEKYNIKNKGLKLEKTNPKKAIEFYKEKDCIDLEDFIDELKKLNKDKEKKNSKIE